MTRTTHYNGFRDKVDNRKCSTNDLSFFLSTLYGLCIGMSIRPWRAVNKGFVMFTSEPDLSKALNVSQSFRNHIKVEGLDEICSIMLLNG